MNHIDLLIEHGACPEGIAFAADYPDLPSTIAACERLDWLLWATDNLMPARQRVAVRCYIVRHTPLADGRTVWDLLTDERSRKRIETEEAWARGEDISEGERAAARAAAWDAVWAALRAAAWAAAWDAVGAAVGAAARAAARDAVGAAARDAARDAAWATAEAAARAWQMAYIKSLDWSAAE